MGASCYWPKYLLTEVRVFCISAEFQLSIKKAGDSPFQNISSFSELYLCVLKNKLKYMIIGWLGSLTIPLIERIFFTIFKCLKKMRWNFGRYYLFKCTWGFFNGFHLFIFPTETVYVCVHVLFRDALYLALFFILTTYTEKQNHSVLNLFTLLPQNDGAQHREQHHTEGGS